jgi:hypothetical protein
LRTFETASKSAIIGDLFRSYAVALREQADCNSITIPEDVELWGSELFDPVTMRKLFALGRQRAQVASPWFTDPPGLRWDSAP